MGRGLEKQERRGNGGKEHEEAKQKPYAEMTLEILIRRQYAQEGSDQGKI